MHRQYVLVWIVLTFSLLTDVNVEFPDEKSIITYVVTYLSLLLQDEGRIRTGQENRKGTDLWVYLCHDMKLPSYRF